jgi:hypothetical protein
MICIRKEPCTPQRATTTTLPKAVETIKAMTTFAGTNEETRKVLLALLHDDDSSCFGDGMRTPSKLLNGVQVLSADGMWLRYTRPVTTAVLQPANTLEVRFHSVHGGCMPFQTRSRPTARAPIAYTPLGRRAAGDGIGPAGTRLRASGAQFASLASLPTPPHHLSPARQKPFSKCIVSSFHDED